MPISFDLTFGATEMDARGGIGQVMDCLEASGLEVDQAGAVQIALAESVNNIVEHAYGGRGAGQIRIKCHLSTDTLRIQICDTGAPLPDQCLPPGRPADVSGARDTLPEGGFGWFLIRELTRDVAYLRENGCNHLVLNFDLARDTQSPTG